MENFKYCGEKGRRQILKSLTESQDPWSTITDLQQTLSLGSTRCESAFSFLNEIGSQKSDIYHTIFERVKFQLEKMLDDKTEQHLAILLRSPLLTKLVTHPELRSILINIIKSLKETPKRYLQLLAKYNCLNELPIALQRKAWEEDEASFNAEIQRLITAFAGADGSFAGPGREMFVRGVREDVGESENLFAKFCGFCSRSYHSDMIGGRPLSPWPGLLLDVVRSHSAASGEQLKRYRKLNELAMLLDSIRRQGFVDAPRLLQVFRLLRVLLMGQAAELDRDIVLRRRRMLQHLPTSPKARSSSSGATSKPKQREVAKAKPARDNFKGAKSPALQELEANEFARMSGPAVRLVLRDGWKEVTMLDHHRVFADRVTDDIAPGYSQIITRPMDLGSILRRLGQSETDGYSLLEMDLDMQLMFTNCLRYNGPSSYYADYARRMRREWASVRSRLLKRITSEAGKGERNLVEATRKLPPDILRTILLRAWEALSKEDANGFFAEPVTDDIAPNYSAEIARPMDFGTMLRNVEGGQYTSIDQFDADVSLVFDNCVQYNGPASVYGKIAGRMQKWWVRFRRQLEDEVISASKEYGGPAPTLTSSSSTAPDAPPEPSQDTKPALDKVQLADALKELLNQLTKADDKGVFAFPDSSRSVQNPMDLSTMRLKLERGRYKSAEAFCNDVDNMVSNYVSLHWEPEKRKYAATYVDAWSAHAERLLGHRPAPIAALAAATLAAAPDTVPSTALNEVEATEPIPAPPSPERCVPAVHTAPATTVEEVTLESVKNVEPADQLKDPETRSAIAAAESKPRLVLKLPKAEAKAPLTTSATAPVAASVNAEREARRKALLESTRRAVKELAPEDACEIPGLLLDGPMAWAALLLREAAVQSAVRLFLAGKLKATAEAMNVQGASVTIILPFQDPFVRMATQLCLLSGAALDKLPELDPSILRVGLPLVVFALAVEVDAPIDRKMAAWDEVRPEGPRGLLDAIFESCLRATT